jgi:cytochrome c-type biogenesis protein CcmH
MSRALAACAVACLALTGCAPPRPAPEARAHRIEAQVWSPYCPGRLLVECTTDQAEQLRSQILERARRGESDARILSWLRRNYGDDVMAKPRATGAGLAVWLVPVAAMLAAAVVLIGLIRRWSAPAQTPAPLPAEETAPDPKWLRRVREQVERDL